MMNKLEKNTKITVAVVGARGYAGAELVRILAQHPQAKLNGLYASAQWNPADALDLPMLKDVPVKNAESLLDSDHQVVFLATPPEVSLDLAPKLLKKGTNVIDLSGAFRLKHGDQQANYKQWYKFEHTAIDELNKAIYGLVPFEKINKQEGTWLISNPGCYATAVALSLIPLLKAGIIDADSIVVDAKSGTTGAGKKPEETLLHSEVSDDCSPYKVGAHQHLPEIKEACLNYAGVYPDFAFTTHLLPVRRGILASCYAKLKSTEGTAGLQAVQSAFEECYGQQPLIRHAPMQNGRSPLIKLTRVVNTARTHFAYTVEGKHVYLFAALDNLMKGAASQAIENFNLCHGWEAHLGLIQEGVSP